MKVRKEIKVTHEFSTPFCVADGSRFRLAKVDPSGTGSLQVEDKPRCPRATRSHWVNRFWRGRWAHTVGCEVDVNSSEVRFCNPDWRPGNRTRRIALPVVPGGGLHEKCLRLSRVVDTTVQLTGERPPVILAIQSSASTGGSNSRLAPKSASAPGRLEDPRLLPGTSELPDPPFRPDGREK